MLTDALIAQRRAEREAAVGVDGFDPARVIADGYHQLLDHGRAAFLAALRRLAEPDGTPSLVHCSAGKDRTGVLVALLLDAAGVERDAIVADYAATDERMIRVRARLAEMPIYAQLASEAPGHAAGRPRRHDGAVPRSPPRRGRRRVTWFVDAGAPPEMLAAWQARILAPAPSS